MRHPSPNDSYNFIRETIETGEVQLKFWNSKVQLSDIFIKVLSKEKSEHLEKWWVFYMNKQTLLLYITSNSVKLFLDALKIPKNHVALPLFFSLIQFDLIMNDYGNCLKWHLGGCFLCANRSLTETSYVSSGETETTGMWKESSQQ